MNTNWIFDGHTKAVLLDAVFEKDGAPDLLSIPMLLARFGQHDLEQRLRSWCWLDASGDVLDDLDGAAFVNTVSGVRVPLVMVPRMLGFDVGLAGAEELARAAREMLTRHEGPMPLVKTHGGQVVPLVKGRA
jgi:hypothetical protein